MISRRFALALLASLALAAAGCGGDDGGGGAEGGGGQSGTAQSGPAETFASTCGGCHTLAAAETEGQVGPNLDELEPSADDVKQAIAQGPGVMPENLLEGAGADEVAQYVADNAGG